MKFNVLKQIKNNILVEKKFKWHKNMLRYIIIISTFISTLGCENNQQTKSYKNQKLIINKDSLLFLDFSFGMRNEDYEVVKGLLINKMKLQDDSNQINYIFKLPLSDGVKPCKAILSNTFDSTNRLTSIILNIEKDNFCNNSQYADEEISFLTFKESNKNNCISDYIFESILSLYINKYGNTKKDKWIKYDSFFESFMDEGDEYSWLDDKRLIKLQVQKQSYYLYNSKKYLTESYNKLKKIKKLGDNIRKIKITYTINDFQKAQDIRLKEELLLRKQRDKKEIESTKNEI
jgi:hypothetical protein